METITWAHDLARDLLQESLPRRWIHTQGVATQAERLAPLLGDGAADLVTAAWVHDIGYAPPLVVTGFHPLDGARYLRDVERFDMRLCRLVAHHSCATVEAGERGILEMLTREFISPDSDVLVDALTYCDMSTGPDGERLTIEDRLADIYDRYGEEHLVGRSIRRAAPRINRAVQRFQSYDAAERDVKRQ